MAPAGCRGRAIVQPLLHARCHGPVAILPRLSAGGDGGERRAGARGRPSPPPCLFLTAILYSYRINILYAHRTSGMNRAVVSAKAGRIGGVRCGGPIGSGPKCSFFVRSARRAAWSPSPVAKKKLRKRTQRDFRCGINSLARFAAQRGGAGMRPSPACLFLSTPPGASLSAGQPRLATRRARRPVSNSRGAGSSRGSMPHSGRAASSRDGETRIWSSSEVERIWQ